MPYLDPEHKRESNVRRSAALRRKKATIIRRAKDVPCKDCGARYPSFVMDFDHRDPTTKEFVVSYTGNIPLERVLREIDKCDVVCANCHRFRTHGDVV